MSPASPSPTLMSYTFAECKIFPKLGEIIAVRLSQDLFGPGSEIATRRNLPPGATRYNFHYAIVLHFVLKGTVSLTIVPIPAYSSTDPVSGLSSTSWLLAQPEDFQRLHIPVPYEEDPTHAHPPFPAPAGFCGPPIEIGGWKNSRPSWVQAVPQVVEMELTTTFKRFNPRVALSNDEWWRIREYCRLHSPVISNGQTRPLGTPLAQPDGKGYGGFPAGTSLALQSLYANDAVKHPLAHLSPCSKPESHFHDSDSDSDDDGEDGMDPIEFLRYYAAGHPAIAEVVQDHDQKMRELCDQRIATWRDGVNGAAN